jgi:uncharacterized membrane protein (TIGR02234 family)
VRELRVAAGLCLVGGALALLAVSKAWLTYRVGTAPLPTRSVDVTGAQLAPGVRVLALVGVAGVAALPAARGRGRTAVGALLAAAGVAIVAVVIRVLADPAGTLSERAPEFHTVRTPELGPWPYVVVLGGLVLVAAGLLVVVRGRRWEAFSARYDPPSERPSPGESGLWDALDRGEDPTRGPSASGG